MAPRLAGWVVFVAPARRLSRLMTSGRTQPRVNLLEGDIRKTLAALTLPTALGIVFVIAIDVTDTLWVGMLGTRELAALSFCFPIIAMIMSATFGLGVGVTSAIARAIGAGDEQRVRRLTSHGIALGVVLVALLAGLGLLVQRPLFAAMGAQGQLLELVVDYMTIWLLGAAFVVVPVIGAAALRATGEMKAPMWIMFVAALANGVLDPIFMFGLGPLPALGLQGAALASLASRFVTLPATLLLLRRLGMLEWRIAEFGELLHSWRAIVSVGLPAALTSLLSPLAAALLTSLIADHGVHTVAAWGVCTRIDSLLTIPLMAIGAALTPFIGQNWAAEHDLRVREGVRLSARFALAWGLLAWLVLALLGRHVGGLFSDDPEVVEIIALALRFTAATYAATGVVIVVNAAFNAIDQAMRGTLISILRSFVLSLPLAWLGDAWLGLEGLLLGLVAAAWLSAGIAKLLARARFDARA